MILQKTPILLLIVGLACGAEAGRIYTDTTPAGMKVELVSDSVRHGSVLCSTLRYRVTNPTAEPREFTLEVGGPVKFGHYRDNSPSRLVLSQTAIVPAQTNVIVTFRPFAGALKATYRLDSGSPLLVDASGSSLQYDNVASGDVSEIYSDTVRDDECLVSPDYNGSREVGKWISTRYVGESEDPCGKVSVTWSDFTHWSDFAAFAGVLLTDKAWQRVPDEVREILADYEAAGGLVIRDGSMPSKNWLRLTSKGKGGFGVPLSEAVALTDELKNPRVPLPLMFVVMLAFALAAGPVLLTVLARRNRRIAILWAFPVVALAFTAALIVIVRIAVGSGPVRETFTQVETVGDREVRRTSVVWFSPTRVHETITFPEDVFVRFECDSRHSLLPRRYTNGGRTLDLRQIPPLWPVRFDAIEVLRK